MGAIFEDTDKDGKITSADNLYISYEDYTMYALITSNTSGNTNDTVLITENPNLKSTLRWPFKFKITGKNCRFDIYRKSKFS